MLPASDPRPPQHWLSCAGTASKRAVYAGYIRPRRLARRPALPFLWPLLRICRPVLVLGRSSRLFRPHLVRCGISVCSLYRLRVYSLFPSRAHPLFRISEAIASLGLAPDPKTEPKLPVTLVSSTRGNPGSTQPPAPQYLFLINVR